MQLLALKDVSITIQDSRFKQSSLTKLIAALLFLGLTIGFFCGYKSGEMPLFAFLVSGGFMFLFSLIFFSFFKKTLSPLNWLMVVGPGRILIKFRSYLNSHLPETDPQVIKLNPEEIISTNIVKQKLVCSSRKNTKTTEYRTSLDIVLADDLSELKERLKYERNLKAKKVKSVVTYRTKTHHYPVSVIDNNIIRIEWKSPASIITPGIKKVIDLLQRQGITIEPKKHEVNDFTKINSKDDKQNEEKILQLAQNGNILAATKLARRVYNYNTTQAKEFVEGLLE